jgi:hypothetical protein
MDVDHLLGAKTVENMIQLTQIKELHQLREPNNPEVEKAVN